jgi:3-hydroxybutyryl-CoA dehydrogenase
MAERTNTVGIIGAGTMGAGIAQVAATHGWNAIVCDVSEEISRKAVAAINAQLDKLVEKGKLAREARDEAAPRLRTVANVNDLRDCDLVIEAIVENLDVKVSVLKPLAAAISRDTIIATNTSSLSVTKIGDAIALPCRTIGMHFFNPAPILKLVEVIPGQHTDRPVIERAMQIARDWGKTPVRAKDTPGFIVNRVARPYYLEAFRILEDGIAPPSMIDQAMRELGGFRMGPLELTDLIGQDINTATTRSVWEQLGRPPRLAPSQLQESLVAQGHLGRKTGQGAYRYDIDPPQAAIRVTIPREPLAASRELIQATSEFADEAAIEHQSTQPLSQYVFARILAAIINECDWAVHDGVASPGDIDTALKLATNYPKGPLEWRDEIGGEVVRRVLYALNATVSDGRFSPPIQRHEGR